jgi:rubrerythrin
MGMADGFRLLEVFRMAEAIERNGEVFYRQAADKAQDVSTRRILQRLAETERQHAEQFATWREQYCGRVEPHVVDWDDQVEAYLRATAASHVFNLNQDVTALLASVQSPAGALRLGLGFEKDTLAFLTALKQTVPAEQQEGVALLIQEEMDHIRQLQEALEALPKK